MSRKRYLDNCPPKKIAPPPSQGWGFGQGEGQGLAQGQFWGWGAIFLEGNCPRALEKNILKLKRMAVTFCVLLSDSIAAGLWFPDTLQNV